MSRESALPWALSHAQLIITGVIALATIAYVVFTVLLWRATGKSADAAKQSADAAKQSADTLGALHRPYLGVSRIERLHVVHLGEPFVEVSITNFGTLPATITEASIGISMDRNVEERHPLSSGEVFPGNSVVTTLPLKALSKQPRPSGAYVDLTILADVSIQYEAPNHERYEHSAKFSYTQAADTFSCQSSQTQQP